LPFSLEFDTAFLRKSTVRTEGTNCNQNFSLLLYRYSSAVLKVLFLKYIKNKVSLFMSLN